MRSQLTIFVWLILALPASGIQAQDKPNSESTPNSVAPIHWRRYEVAERKISFMFPKLPVVNEDDSPCEEIDGAIYRAYAAQVVYEFAWYAKRDGPPPGFCEASAPFGPQSYLKLLAELRRSTNVTETTTTIGTGDAQKATVFQLTPRSAATCRTGGRKVPWGSSPVAIKPFISSTIC